MKFYRSLGFAFGVSSRETKKQPAQNARTRASLLIAVSLALAFALMLPMTAVSVFSATTADGAGEHFMTERLSERQARYLEKRGIDLEVASRFGLYTDQQDGRVLVFPYVDGGEVVNHKYRRLPKDGFHQDVGARKTFWNADVLDDPALRGGERLIITEGEFDALAAIQSGFPFTVSVPDGAPQVAKEDDTDSEHDRKFSYLQANDKRLQRVSQFVLAVDADGPGQALAKELARRLCAARCWFVEYPEGCKDLNDVLLKHGVAGVKAVIDGAKRYPVKGLYKLSDYPDQGELLTFSTGWSALDPYLKLWLGEFMVVTGVPSHGKSRWALDLVANLVDEHHLRQAIASFEMPTKPHLHRLLREHHVGRAAGPELNVQADAWIEENFTFIDYDPRTDDDDIDLAWVLTRAEEAVLRHGVDVLLLDPWNEIEHRREPGESETDYTSRAIRAIKRFARSFQVAVIVIAHPTKDVRTVTGKVRKPTLYDISGSANWANKCDHGIVVDRPDLEHTEVEITVKKCRFEETGKPGTVLMRLDRNAGRFFAVEDDTSQAKMAI